MTIADADAGSETVDDLHNGKWADLSLQLSNVFDFVVDPMVDQVIDAEGITRNRTNLRNQKNALSFLIANLLQLHLMDASAYCRVDRSNGFYRSSPYNPFRIGARALRRCFDFLRDNGFIEVRGGNFNRSGEGSPGGLVTRCRAQTSLLVALDPSETEEGEIGEAVSPGITRNTNSINDINSIQSLSLFRRAPLPIIRMKNENKDLIETPEHPDLNRMTTDLARINDYLEDHWIDLCIPDAELPQALTNQETNEDGLPGQRINSRSHLNLATQRTLYRVFNYASFDHGGRFYGGWWQQIKSKYRKFITINWHPVSEIDFSSMQPAILYALEGIPAPEDAYVVDGIPSEYRDLLKKILLQIINAADEHMRAPRREELPEGMSFRGLKDALRAKHSAISRHFNSGIGTRIQRIDSDIAETVMLTMMEEGQLVLPVHDSFIVRSSDENVERLKEVMREASAHHLNQELNLTLDPEWMDELVTE
ncbi:MAG: hypothetical protein AAGA50_30495, partial [Pseudomonadota bacterium]